MSCDIWGVMIADNIKNIDPAGIADIEGLKKAVEILIGAVENLSQEIEELKKKNGELMDENARLKGGNGRPKIKGKNKVPTNISSGGKEKGIRKEEEVKLQQPKKCSQIEIDKEIRVEMDRATLPPDAIFKGYQPYYQQDIEVVRNNKRFLLASYYSPSEKKTYRAAFPEDELSGHFGPGVRSLINILHHYGNVTESCLAGMMKGFGIQISAGSISNLLKAEQSWSAQEQRAILRAGLAPGTPIQMDCTGNRQRGENKTTHIITAPLFSVFYTLGSKSRMDCLRALQGNPVEGIRLMWHKNMENAFREAKVSQSDSAEVMRLLKTQDNCQLSTDEFNALLQSQAPAIHKKRRIVLVLTEVMALHYYDHQDEFRRLKVLLTDDAPEYNKIAEHHGLCWVHDARYYNKLSPQMEVCKQKLDTFKGKYWEFYQSLLDYKFLSQQDRDKTKPEITRAFDQLFTPTTRYGQLDLCIERTLANKDQLLLVLAFPNLPLHNNAAELAARRVVRKRDISLHTWTDWGTELRDSFLSILETARKLNVSAYRYIHDRITGQLQMPSLATLVARGSP
jgi:regulator of replication initiation timing